MSTESPEPRLPYDVLIEVLNRLQHDEDVLSMLMTCSTIYKSTLRNKRVLARNLHMVCERYGMFKSSFPWERMSLRELDHAIAAPQQFLQIFESGSGSDIIEAAPIARTQVVPFERNEEFDHLDPETGATNVILVPGGRFLFVAEGPKITLWDLGYNANHDVQRSPIAIDENLGGMYAISPTLSGEGVLLAVGSFDPDPDFPGTGPHARSLFSLHIIGIDPTQGPDCRFELKATLTTAPLRDVDDMDEEVACLTHDRAVLWSKPYLAVWNWVEDTGCCWMIQSSQLSQVWLYGDEVVGKSISDDSVCLLAWHIPPLKPFRKGPAGGRTLRRLDFLHQHSIIPLWFHIVGPDWGPLSLSDRTWQPQTSLGLNICQATMVYATTYQSDLNIYRIGMRKTESELEAEANSGKSCRIPFLYNSDTAVQRATSPLLQCDGRMMFCTSTANDGLVATLLPRHIVNEKGRTNPAVRPILRTLTAPGTLCKAYLVKVQAAGFCPLSGRLAYVTSSKDVHVVDYLTVSES
ncbi:hypothetical protein DFP72DRAFT_911876 [Ephemerocybe angulata]|uniref:F-box domain-containing protein n=1 Tax=Ephemerocybe angulata TaxID=980116 RepID=A0A8H6M0I1_9AGAR|nr:hypothetical protein DFP72DRAFT_911876 [Tulosesus angulatus]